MSDLGQSVAWPFRPDWRVHPGETLRDVLGERGLKQTYVAWAMGYSLKHVNQVIQGHASITAAFAVRLEDAIGEPSAEFWMTLQMHYDLHAAREAWAQEKEAKS